MKNFCSLVLVLIVPFLTLAQQEERPLPPNINQPSINLYAPFISGNGKVLVYLSDYADDGHHTMYFSKRESFEWEDGREINKLVNRPTLNFRGGYALDYTGDRLFFSSRKSGLGGFDLWMSKRKGNDWSAPENMGSPLNSRENEGSPVITPDGELLYFMRCETMEPYRGAGGCRIMVSEQKNGKWSEPIPLPDNINTGNSQTPRILGDGETLIFSSDKMGGKGGLDLFMSQKTENGWSDPVPMDFINTSKDDAFISVPAKGRYIYMSKKGARDYELIEKLLPEEFRPMRVMRISGTVHTPENATLLVFRLNDRNRLWNEELSDGKKFALALNEGESYDISISNRQKGYGYFSKILELDEIGRIDRMNFNVNLKPLVKGDTLSASIFIDRHQIDEKYTFELRRIADFIKQNPERKVGINILQTAYREDSIAAPELTEIRYDTLFSPPQDTVLNDLLQIAGRKVLWGSDSVSIISDQQDTITYTAGWFKVKKTYHNDRTAAQEKLVHEFMRSRRVDSSSYLLSRTLVPAKTPKAIIGQMDGQENESEQAPERTERLIAVIRE